jgi:GTP-binding protein
MSEPPREIIVDATFVAAAPDVRDLPAPVFAEVAFAGKSNVGKSSLINALVGRRKLARTSNTPGRTRELVLFRVQLRDGSFDLVDLPGYGYAKVSKSERRAWGPMIERFLQQRAGLRCVVLIIDVRRGLSDDDVQLLEFLATCDLPALLIATKLDKLPHSKVEPALRALQREAGTKVLGFSAETGYGRDALLRTLLEHTGLMPKRPAS